MDISALTTSVSTASFAALLAGAGVAWQGVADTKALRAPRI